MFDYDAALKILLKESARVMIQTISSLIVGAWLRLPESATSLIHLTEPRPSS
jgi:hypothetical protein